VKDVNDLIMAGLTITIILHFYNFYISRTNQTNGKKYFFFAVIFFILSGLIFTKLLDISNSV